VTHSRTGGTAALTEAAASGAAAAAGNIAVTVLDAFDTQPADVLGTGAVVLATPAHFGYMSGALKDCFERIYYPCLEHTVGLPYALIVKGNTDTSGAVASVERIVKGLQWKAVTDPITVVGDVTPAALEAASELGATLAAGLDFGLY